MLPKENRLKRDKDFKKVFKEGRPFFTKIFTIKITKNDLKVSRFAFVVSTKISKKAVKRNKIRRQLREVVRLKLKDIKAGFDIVVVAKPEIIDKDYGDIEKTLLWAIREINLI